MTNSESYIIIISFTMDKRRYGNKGVLELLLSKGAILESQTDEKLTPMHLAARAGSVLASKIS